MKRSGKLLEAMEADGDPSDEDLLVYADALEEEGDARANHIRRGLSLGELHLNPAGSVLPLRPMRVDLPSGYLSSDRMASYWYFPFLRGWAKTYRNNLFTIAIPSPMGLVWVFKNKLDAILYLGQTNMQWLKRGEAVPEQLMMPFSHWAWHVVVGLCDFHPRAIGYPPASGQEEMFRRRLDVIISEYECKLAKDHLTALS